MTVTVEHASAADLHERQPPVVGCTHGPHLGNSPSHGPILAVVDRAVKKSPTRTQGEPQRLPGARRG